MTKELYVSSTPHETKVGMVEDDLLAEIYLERENEYTLAGSIYKGRVTRVLPGMQSAFVDIGLERDAFLYVSDFMELEDHEDVDNIPANRPVQEPVAERTEPRREQQPVEAHSAGSEGEPSSAAERHETSSQPAEGRESSQGQGGDADGRGNWRSRRRRRGRRGERMPDSKFASTAVEAPRETQRPERTERSEKTERPERERSDRSDRPARSERNDYGPPPGYQPILLPGESISKYARLAQPKSSSHQANSQAPLSSFSSETSSAPQFAEDEPFFASSSEVRNFQAVNDHASPSDIRISAAPDLAPFDTGTEQWDREQKRLHEENVASVFGTKEESKEQNKEENQGQFGNSAADGHAGDRLQATPVGTIETIEEEVIEEEEADLAHYVEELEEDATFEEMEEETRAAEDYRDHGTQDIAAVGQPVNEGTEFRASVEHADVEHHEISAEPMSLVEGQGAVDEIAAEEEEAEAEIEEAQAEAEAILDAEARGNGTVDARVEVRAPEANAAYTQRAPRPAYDRRPQRGGRRGGNTRGPRFRRNEQSNLPQITDLLKEGQEILVQIAKEPINKKGARITSHIALPGRFLVYMPTVNHTGVSRKISSEEERQRLKRIILSERENGHGGFIVRTAAQGADEEELRADIRFLKGLWSEIKTRADDGKAPALIYHDLNVVERVLRDQVTSDFSAIWVDTEQEYERILRFANRFQPALVRKVKLYTKETPLFEQFGLSEEINKALKSKVWLKSGGYIVINQTEALVAIDVNTGKYVGKTTRLEDTIVKTNVDAIKEIVRQIRLRDLGGIIIIDFIDMDERRNRQKVMQALEEALRSDRAPSKVLQFNDFGLVAITRKRVKQSLERTIGSPCPYCESTGFVKSVTTVCNEIYLEMRKLASHLTRADVMLRVNPEVAKALKGNNGKALLEMEELTKKTVIIKSDAALHQEQFDIN
ncbi:MAG: Rne/Rng family ribonuclease [Acidobacteriota bacterium]|nr:Rne/Rng family ribonuclease [Acidobacteriota bacterium]